MSEIGKRSKTKLEKLFKLTWYKHKKGIEFESNEESAAVMAIKETLKFFAMYDFLENTEHSKIIAAVYLSVYFKKKGKKYREIVPRTRVGFARTLFISAATLARYTKLYIKCFEKHFNDISAQI